MYGSHTGLIRSAGTAAAVCAALLLTGCAGGDGGGSEGAPAIGQQPREKDPYWVNPEGNAARQVAAYEKDGDREKAGLIRKIAEQPMGEWIGPDDPEGEARRVTEAAARADRYALLVLYNIPHRDCGQFSKGGAADAGAYRAWVDGVARGIGDRRATVILEPDALLHLVDGCTPQEHHDERYALLGSAVERLKRQPATQVYIDAGNAAWQSPDALHEPLRRAGIEKADGFSLNVSNFLTTAVSTEFGKKLSAKVGDKPFVIDTSRNGNGPYEGGDPAETWCNPPGRALGEPPTTATGDAKVDAYLWIKRPGESDGDCKGGPKAGDWWPEYALGLARATR
ncbi:glycoside hydrolase family 6 protein [Streptomyces bacillaris]|uniref:glycoside hydrolase family 6 protein n=1 Tax=Streptomyces TaxID=1883 RepID=UPI000DC659FD|nr:MULTISPECIES: glycoside hydrolase family 6 protein [Streptomyces]NUW22506.1 glycoside hydrolase family 6 protein [Streptomyces roseoviolaceus]ATY95895.1 endoglucanase [Streptomyces cavourensis]MBH0246385.1 glycoside hydrolase family 6 protein [Streptomyces cavourensis]NUV80710.1 glycoside hydrolase family 6 protein [Streptomyces sp. CAI-155]NUV89150.1 glycoside hydrolase family 6 protein [Streptomyces sp. KAI-26]